MDTRNDIGQLWEILWLNTYANASFEVISKDNYLEFLQEAVNLGSVNLFRN
jgi:hypothetical protein